MGSTGELGWPTRGFRGSPLPILAVPCPQVDEVFELSLTHLLQTQNHGYTHFRQGGHFRYTLPVFLHGPHRVWGITAVITEFTLKLLAPGIYQPCLSVPKQPWG